MHVARYIFRSFTNIQFDADAFNFLLRYNIGMKQFSLNAYHIMIVILNFHIKQIQSIASKGISIFNLNILNI